MAAPKNWGYTREEDIADELLVSWTDGDLTEILAKELEERLLTHAHERAKVAAYARACLDSSVATGDDPRLVFPRPGVAELCKSQYEEPVPAFERPLADPASRRPAMALPRIPAATAVRAGSILIVSALLLLWMIRNL